MGRLAGRRNAGRPAVFIQTAFFSMKSFPLFAFLFGWGMVRMDEAARREGRDPADAWRRRMIALLVAGMAHACLVFAYDILMIYALLGLFLARLRQLDDRTVWAHARNMLIVSTAMYLLVALGGLLALTTDGPIGESGGDEGGEDLGRLGYWAVVALRLAELPTAQGYNIGYNVPLSYVAFALGVLAARHDFFARAAPAFERVRPLVLPCAMAGLATAAPLSIVYALDLPTGRAAEIMALALSSIGAPLLCLPYVVWSVQLARSAPRFCAPLAASGRMSLTAYVLEGVIAGFVFYGYGLGLFGETGFAGALAIAFAIVVLIKLFCGLWLRVFPQGPLEWLTRQAALSGRLAGS